MSDPTPTNPTPPTLEQELELEHVQGWLAAFDADDLDGAEEMFCQAPDLARAALAAAEAQEGGR